jgi:hypothetical protein
MHSPFILGDPSPCSLLGKPVNVRPQVFPQSCTNCDPHERRPATPVNWFDEDHQLFPSDEYLRQKRGGWRELQDRNHLQTRNYQHRVWHFNHLRQRIVQTAGDRGFGDWDCRKAGSGEARLWQPESGNGERTAEGYGIKSRHGGGEHNSGLHRGHELSRLFADQQLSDIVERRG